MLRIKIDLIYGGFGNPEEIGKMEIWNDGTGSQTIGNYGFKLFRKGSDSVFKSGEVKGYKRQQWSVWYLIYLCLKKIYGK